MNPENSSADNARARTGKIARLPLHDREQLNRRLQNGEEGKKLVEWLNSVAETQPILAAESATMDDFRLIEKRDNLL